MELGEASDGSDAGLHHALISPDGQTVALLTGHPEGGDRVQLVDVSSGDARVVFEAAPCEGDYHCGARLEAWSGGHELAVTTVAIHRYLESPWIEHTQVFDWAGVQLLAGGCQGELSPDRRYVARPEGHSINNKYKEIPLPPEPWASVIIADAVTCEPAFRVRSAYPRAWLGSSDGFVVGVAPHAETGEAYAVARVGPHPELAYLPVAGSPAPGGDGRYFAEGRFGIYDAILDRWIPPPFSPSGPAPDYWWSDWTSDGDELRYVPSEDLGHSIVPEWILLQPKIEIPPLGEEAAFRVIGAGTCVELSDEGRHIDCLDDGTRVVSASGGYSHRDGSFGIRVRTHDGSEGWVPIENLEWY